MTPRLARLARAAALTLMLPATSLLLAQEQPVSACCHQYRLTATRNCLKEGGVLTVHYCQDWSPTTCDGWYICEKPFDPGV